MSTDTKFETVEVPGEQPMAEQTAAVRVNDEGQEVGGIEFYDTTVGERETHWIFAESVLNVRDWR